MKNLARSGEERANADCHVKNPARCGEEKAKEVNFPVKEQASCGLDKEANVSDNRPVNNRPVLCDTYQGSYMARIDGHNDAIEERNNPMLYNGVDDVSRKYSSSIEGLTQRC